MHEILFHSVRFARSLGWRTIFLQYVLLGIAVQALGQAPSGAKSVVQFDSMVDALIKKVSPSVVQIIVTAYAPIEDSGRGNTGAVIGRQRASGSGFVIDSEG